MMVVRPAVETRRRSHAARLPIRTGPSVRRWGQEEDQHCGGATAGGESAAVAAIDRGCGREDEEDWSKNMRRGWRKPALLMVFITVTCVVSPQLWRRR